MSHSPRIAVLLDNGFEIAEAMICIDILRRTLIHVDVISCADSPQLLSYFNIPVQADMMLAETWDDTYDAVLLPGGPSGTDNLTTNPKVIATVLLGKYNLAQLGGLTIINEGWKNSLRALRT